MLELLGLVSQAWRDELAIKRLLLIQRK